MFSFAIYLQEKLIKNISLQVKDKISDKLPNSIPEHCKKDCELNEFLTLLLFRYKQTFGFDLSTTIPPPNIKTIATFS